MGKERDVLAELARAVGMGELGTDKDDSSGPRVIDAKEKYAQLPEAMAEELARRLEVFRAPRAFKVGDLVTQAPGLSMYAVPHEGFPAVVTAVYERRKEERSATSQELFVTGNIAYLMGKSGEFCEFSVDLQRFVPWEQPVKTTTRPAKKSRDN